MSQRIRSTATHTLTWALVTGFLGYLTVWLLDDLLGNG